MTNDDRSTDQFIREVDEELRREQLNTLWQRYGSYVVAAAVLVVLVTAGFNGWDWWREREAERVGDLYIAAEDLIDEDGTDAAVAAFEAIAAEEKGGYSALASLRAANLKIQAGDRAGAIGLLDRITADDRVDEILQDLARLRAAYLLLDERDMDGAAMRVSPLAATGNPWRHGAREVLGLVALEKGDADTAIGYFSEIETDAEAPNDIRARATSLIAVMQGAQSSSAGGTGSPDAGDKSDGGGTATQ